MNFPPWYSGIESQSCLLLASRCFCLSSSLRVSPVCPWLWFFTEDFFLGGVEYKINSPPSLVCVEQSEAAGIHAIESRHLPDSKKDGLDEKMTKKFLRQLGKPLSVELLLAKEKNEQGRNGVTPFTEAKLPNLYSPKGWPDLLSIYCFYCLDFLAFCSGIPYFLVKTTCDRDLITIDREGTSERNYFQVKYLNRF